MLDLGHGSFAVGVVGLHPRVVRSRILAVGVGMLAVVVNMSAVVVIV